MLYNDVIIMLQQGNSRSSELWEHRGAVPDKTRLKPEGPEKTATGEEDVMWEAGLSLI